MAIAREKLGWFAWPGPDTERWRSFVARLGRCALAHRLDDVAASTAFWGLLAIFPFLFFAVSVIGLAFGHDSVEAVVQMVTTIAPDAVQSSVRGFVASVVGRPSGSDALLAFVVAIWSATGGAVSLGDALNRASGVREDRRGFVERRLQALVAVLVSALCMLLATAVITFAPRIVDRLLAVAGLGPWAGVAWRLIRFPLGLFFAAFAWALAYRMLPCEHGPFRLLTPGAVLGIPLWIGLSVAFSYYVAHFGNYGTAYGSLGGAVIFLLWAWLSTLVLLVGGEINALSHELRERAS